MCCCCCCCCEVDLLLCCCWMVLSKLHCHTLWKSLKIKRINYLLNTHIHLYITHITSVCMVQMHFIKTQKLKPKKQEKGREKRSTIKIQCNKILVCMWVFIYKHKLLQTHTHTHTHLKLFVILFTRESTFNCYCYCKCKHVLMYVYACLQWMMMIFCVASWMASWHLFALVNILWKCHWVSHLMSFPVNDNQTVTIWKLFKKWQQHQQQQHFQLKSGKTWTKKCRKKITIMNEVMMMTMMMMMMSKMLLKCHDRKRREKRRRRLKSKIKLICFKIEIEACSLRYEWNILRNQMSCCQLFLF